jgi:hypothetical protein
LNVCYKGDVLNQNSFRQAEWDWLLWQFPVRFVDGGNELDKDIEWKTLCGRIYEGMLIGGCAWIFTIPLGNLMFDF